MKAIRISETGGSEVLKLVDAPTPSPSADEALIKVEAAGVNFADIMTRRGTYVNMPELPVTPGMDFAGIVESVGANVHHVAVGDRVVGMNESGGYAEYALSHSSVTRPIPEYVNFPVACALPISGMTAYHLTNTLTRPKAGDAAMVYAAAGSVGLFLVQLLKLRKAEVVALVGSKEKAGEALNFGADHAVNYSDENFAEQVKDALRGRGVNFIYNAVAGPTLSADFQLAAPFGTVVLYGQAGGPPSPKGLYVSLMNAFTKCVSLSTYYLSASLREHPKEHQVGWMRMFVWLQSGDVRVPIRHVYLLEEAAKAHADIEARRTIGKVILKP